VATVLVADDDRTILDLVAFTLRGAGHRVVACTDGPSVLSAARLERPDLILLDVAMPGVTGLEVCRTLRAESGTAGVPVVMLTARAQWFDVSTGFESGADDYIVKPFNPSDLVQRVELMLRSAGSPQPTSPQPTSPQPTSPQPTQDGSSAAP
jgi:DNA-binding response OmpR family regulator